MKRVMKRSVEFVWVAAGICLFGGVAAPAVVVAEPAAPAAERPAKAPAAGQLKVKDIILNSLPADAKVIGLEFTVLKIDSAGSQAAVDPVDHSFSIGDSFLVKIRPQDDVYVYVFTEGPSGKRACLLPEDAAAPLLVKQDSEISLPENGGTFTFEEPAGEEKLVVVALKKPNTDLDRLAAAAFREPGKTLNNTEREQQEKGNAVIDGLRERGGNRVKIKGGSMLTQQVQDVLDRAGKEEMRLISPPDEAKAQTEVVGVNTSEIIIDIPLRSQAAAQK